MNFTIQEFNEQRVAGIDSPGIEIKNEQEALELIANAPPDGFLDEDANREIGRVIADADEYILGLAASDKAASVI